TVTTTNRTGDVVVHVPQATQLIGQSLCWGGQLFLLRQWQNRNLDRRQTTIQLQHDAGVSATLGVWNFFLGISINQKSHHGTAQAGSWRDNVWNPAFVGGLVEVGQVFTGVLRVHAQVIVSTVSNALQLAPLGTLEAECVLHIDGALGVVREL